MLYEGRVGVGEPLLELMFGEQQMSVLADQIRAAIMLAYMTTARSG